MYPSLMNDRLEDMRRVVTEGGEHKLLQNRTSIPENSESRQSPK